MTSDLLSLLSGIVADYLSLAASTSAGVPDPASVPIRSQDHAGNSVAPQLTVRAEITESSGRLRTVSIMPVLTVALGTGTGQVTRAQASTWMEAVDQRMSDQSAFMAYVATLSEATRTGWMIAAWSAPSGPEIVEREGERTMMDIGITQRWRIAVRR